MRSARLSEEAPDDITEFDDMVDTGYGFRRRAVASYDLFDDPDDQSSDPDLEALKDAGIVDYE
jgi:hypothetical protein